VLPPWWHLAVEALAQGLISGPRSSALSMSNSKDCLIASVTFDVVEAPAASGHGTFCGVASSYLAKRTPGDCIPCRVRPTKLSFRLSLDTESLRRLLRCIEVN
jgi:sulfite reductase alpha subunit-like flavoprotein